MKKILFIEDERELNEAYRTKFSKEYEIDFAMDAESGLKKATEFLPDLIILDIIMPGQMNGLGLLKEIKNNPYTFRIPVLVLTNLEGQESDVKQAGAVDCLVKANTSFENVEQKVKSVLE